MRPMMTQQVGFSILTAPLAAIDRRSLSQAWYSALHLETRHAPAPGPEARRDPSAPCAPRGRLPQSSAPAGPRAAMVSAPRAPRAEMKRSAPDERRAVRSPLARRIERTFLDPARRVSRATFSVEGTRARVHVTLQSRVAGLRLVAVCPLGVRAQVSRALDQARYALALRGIALQIDLNAGEPA